MKLYKPLNARSVNRIDLYDGFTRKSVVIPRRLQCMELKMHGKPQVIMRARFTQVMALVGFSEYGKCNYH